MNFKEAYEKMREGKKVRRKSESNTLYYNFELDGIYYETQDKRYPYSCRYFLISTENALAEDWEVVEDEEKKKEYWKPKKDEKYFFISLYGASETTNEGYYVDDFNFSIGNYFKTEEEAEHMVEKLKVIHEIQTFAFENNEKEIDWYDDNQYKYILKYDTNDDDIFVGAYTSFINNPFNIYFTSEEIALKAIDIIGADRIKKYYFGIEE